MKITRWALALLGFLIAAPVAAQTENPWYIGVSGALAKYKENCKNLPIPCDQTDLAYRGFGGYRFSKHWSAEVGYADLGESRAEGQFAGGPADLSYRVEGLDAVALLMAPMSERLSPYAKFGIFRMRTVVNVNTVTGAQDAADNSSGWTFGAGLQYDIGRLGLRAEWQRYWNVGAANTGEDDIDVYSLALLFRF